MKRTVKVVPNYLGFLISQVSLTSSHLTLNKTSYGFQCLINNKMALSL